MRAGSTERPFQKWLTTRVRHSGMHHSLATLRKGPAFLNGLKGFD
jgi:hypothetical protein